MTTLICSIPEKLDASLERLAQEAKVPKAKFVRKVLELAAREPRPSRSAFNLVRKLSGSLTGPSDLATNPEYLEGLGRLKSDIIVDTGPLVAFLVKQETHHKWVVDQFHRLRAPFLTCDAVLTETFFLVRKLPHGPANFFSLLNSGLLHVDFSIVAEGSPLEKLVLRYTNVPMSLADACLVRLARLHSHAVVFTLDRDFQIYRRQGNQPLSILMP